MCVAENSGARASHGNDAIKTDTHFDSNSCHHGLELTASELQKVFQQM